ncbi:MAG: DUF5666 domain-containing protein, partial [Pseudomonadota bacterium]
MKLRHALAVLASVALLLAACGGGGGVGSGGTGGYASGAIAGFGSVIVNDIVFDDSAADVRDGSDTARARSDLRLGMTVEVDSDAIVAGAARASRIRFDSALVGPVAGVDVAADRFTVLGQVVTVDETTVFDDRLAGRLSRLSPGARVEVYALYDAALQRYRASRVDLLVGEPPAYRVRGVASAVDRGARTLQIGSATFAYDRATGVPADLADGQFVRLSLPAAPPIGGHYEVTAFGTAVSGLPELDGVVIKGLVSRLASAASFAVDGRPVDASAAQFEGGTPALGLRVEVEGAMRGGVLRARTVRLKSDEQERSRGFDLRGPIESVGTTVPRSFV